MEKRTIRSYFYFGTAVRYAQDAQAGWTLALDGGILENLDEIFKYLESLNMIVTSLLPAVRDLKQTYARLKGEEEGYKLTDVDAQEIRQAMTAVRPTLMAELSTSSAFIVTDKRWDATKLLDSVGALFRPDLFAKLPEIARTDFHEAGKCIAFERSTAAAFHLLRGTESVLRAYYCSVVRQKRLPAHQQNWGPMVKQMRERRTPPPAAILDNLDNIRINYRNPTQHPELSYDVHTAQDLLGLCIDAVNRMAAAMS
jgi:hypothetical protein